MIECIVAKVARIRGRLQDDDDDDQVFGVFLGKPLA
jgi:hypothetical protein